MRLCEEGQRFEQRRLRLSVLLPLARRAADTSLEGPTNSEKEPRTSATLTCTSSVNLPASISPLRKGIRSDRVFSAPSARPMTRSREMHWMHCGAGRRRRQGGAALASRAERREADSTAAQTKGAGKTEPHRRGPQLAPERARADLLRVV